MAIQRGFNILDDLGEALLGTAYFLVRPYPPPDDLNPQIMSLNAWLLDQLEAHYRMVKPEYGTTLQAIDNLRQVAHKKWTRRLRTKGFLSSLDESSYQELLRDSFVTIWQTIGRMIRSGRSARVIFVDDAFADNKGKRHMLRDWHALLQTLFQTTSPFEKQLAIELYGVAWQAFDTAMTQRRF